MTLGDGISKLTERKAAEEEGQGVGSDWSNALGAHAVCRKW